MLLLYALSRPDYMDSDTFHNLFVNISEERQIRIKACNNEVDKIQSLLAEILLRYVLRNKLSIPSSKIIFYYNENGKPSIKGMNNIFFNISHSGKWIVCGIGNANIGVDVEEYKNIGLDIAKRFFCKKEYNAILSNNHEEQLRTFYKFWTLKESYIKATGKGLSIPLSSFYFKLNESEIEIFINGCLSKEYSFINYQLDSLHTISVCWQGDTKDLFNAIFQEISLQDILLFN